MAETACESEPVPMKPTHARWCALVASGEDRAAAYRQACTKAGETMSNDAARQGALRLSQNVACQREVSRLRKAAEKMAGGTVLTILEKRLYLASVVRTPLGKINEHSPLCQELFRSKRKADEDGTEPLPGMGEQLEFWITEKVKKPDVLRAIELDSKLAGEFSEDRLNGALSDGLEGVLARL